jgi:hypothetical protein
LFKKYHGNISALDAAWTANYTGFDSSGIKRTEAICTGEAWSGSESTCSATLSYTNISPLSVKVKIDGVLQGGDCPWWGPRCRDNMANTGTFGGPRISFGFTPRLANPDTVSCGSCTDSTVTYSVVVRYHTKPGYVSAASRSANTGWITRSNKLRVHSPMAKSLEGIDVGKFVTGYDVYAVCINGNKGPAVPWCLPHGTATSMGNGLETLQAADVPLGTDWLMPDTGLVAGSTLPEPTNSIDYTTGNMKIAFYPPLSSGTHNITIEYVQNGWMFGTGLMDEDGRNPWVGTNVLCLQSAAVCDGKMEPLPNANRKLGEDIDGWVSQFAARYFKSIRQAIPANVLYLGPDAMGTWGAPARKEIMMGAGPYIDAIYPSAVIPTLSQVEYTQRWLGDKPMISQMMFAATPDSALFRYHGASAGVYDFSTQSERGMRYFDSVSAAINARASNGIYPYVGVSFWGLTDFWNEKTDWGLISLNDNAYDGHEAVIQKVSCSPPIEAMKCGGEERNYGDAISKIKQANQLWLTVSEATRFH